MPTEPSPEDESKDEFFDRLAKLSEEMVAKHAAVARRSEITLEAALVAARQLEPLLEDVP